MQFNIGDRVVHPLHGRGTVYNTVCAFDGFVYVKFDNSEDIQIVMVERLDPEVSER